MRTRAAVALEAGKPLQIMEVNLDGPKAGDHVIPLYTPECRECYSCRSGKTNLCTAIRNTQGQGLIPDGTTRFSMLDGTPMGTAVQNWATVAAG